MATTVAELGDSRRIRWRRFRRQSPNAATVAVFCDSRRFRRLSPNSVSASFYCRRFRRLYRL